MEILLTKAKLYGKGGFDMADVLVRDGLIVDISPKISHGPEVLVKELNNCFLFPGFIDVHVHLREPGFFYKETIKTGSLAAAHGGYTDICAMPNLSPAPDSRENLKVEQRIIDADGAVNVHPYGCITKNRLGKELCDYSSMEGAVAFSDDGSGVQSREIMKAAMLAVKDTGKILAAHCEDDSLLHGGYIHDGEYARRHRHRSICSQSEWRQIERDIELVRETGCRYHVCHISTKESVDIIRRAKAEGLDVTCETGPHYLLMNDMMLREDGRFKMNPPLRSEEDRLSLIEGIRDGTIDMIATDHAPHSKEEKAKGLEKSAMGVVGLETAFPLLYTGLVKTGIISLERLIALMHDNPLRRFGIGSQLEIGQRANLTAFDLNDEYVIDPETFLSKGRSTPFEGWRVSGKCRLTIVNGRMAWSENSTEN